MINRRSVFTFLVTLSVLFPLSPETKGQATLLRIRKEDSHVGFSVYKWAVFKEEGRFKDFDGVIEFDPDDLTATKVEFSVNASSIDSRNPDRDGALRSEDFFHVTRYPSLRFKSASAKAVDRSTMLVEGDLTIRGITKRITLPVKVSGVHRAGGRLGTLVGFESTFSLNREDFNVGKGWEIIGKDVTISLIIGAGSGQTTASR